jgi:hypothetical protein
MTQIDSGVYWQIHPLESFEVTGGLMTIVVRDRYSVRMQIVHFLAFYSAPFLFDNKEIELSSVSCLNESQC